jgi:hypothetical protein
MAIPGRWQPIVALHPWEAAHRFPIIMDRATRIDQALAKRNYSPALQQRIERLLDGEEDRTRLRCCNSGCFVCVQELLAILEEVEST